MFFLLQEPVLPSLLEAAFLLSVPRQDLKLMLFARLVRNAPLNKPGQARLLLEESR
jgi:hypothetical protein